jgi:hypothetical protein
MPPSSELKLYSVIFCVVMLTSPLKMEAVCSSETFVSTYKSTRHHSKEDPYWHRRTYFINSECIITIWAVIAVIKLAYTDWIGTVQFPEEALRFFSKRCHRVGSCSCKASKEFIQGISLPTSVGGPWLWFKIYASFSANFETITGNKLLSTLHPFLSASHVRPHISFGNK